jgi:phenylalanyl-tRNA synthetase alpha chain
MTGKSSKMGDNSMPHEISSLERAREAVIKENPDLPMSLKFEVSSPEILEKLLSVKDLTEPTKEDETRNIIGKIFDNIVRKLKEHNWPNVEVVRGDSVVSIADNFDNLLFPAGNPGRSSTYTRYSDEEHVLRTHTSALIPQIFRKMASGEIDQNTLVLPGLVFRRDVIDPRHLDVFHQIDVWTIQNTAKHGQVKREDLLELVKVIFEAACPDAEMVVYEAKHPYTVDGIEVYAKVDGKEIEVLEAGLIHPEVLRKANIDPEKYCGLASGMGVERLVMARKNLPDIRLIRSKDPRVVKQMGDLNPYVDVSNQPAISRDISYSVSSTDAEEDICEMIRNAFGKNSDLLEEVIILERTPFEKLHPKAIEKLGAVKGQDNVLVRIILRHPDRTLRKEEAAEMYAAAYPILHQGKAEGYKV